MFRLYNMKLLSNLKISTNQGESYMQGSSRSISPRLPTFNRVLLSLPTVVIPFSPLDLRTTLRQTNDGTQTKPTNIMKLEHIVFPPQQTEPGLNFGSSIILCGYWRTEPLA